MNAGFTRVIISSPLSKLKSMNIHQLNVSHDERQDRLLLRLNTPNLQEFRFWLTRRMTMRLVPAIEQSALRLEAAQPGVAAADAPTQQMLGELKREAFLSHANFATPFKDQATQWPLGTEPLLVTDARLSIQAQGALELAFEDKSDPTQSKTCKMLLPLNLVHGMVHLIQQASEKAQWRVVDITQQATAPDPSSPPTPPRYTH
jgi:hypothetical protein